MERISVGYAACLRLRNYEEDKQLTQREAGDGRPLGDNKTGLGAVPPRTSSEIFRTRRQRSQKPSSHAGQPSPSSTNEQKSDRLRSLF